MKCLILFVCLLPSGAVTCLTVNGAPLIDEPAIVLPAISVPAISVPAVSMEADGVGTDGVETDGVETDGVAGCDGSPNASGSRPESDSPIDFRKVVLHDAYYSDGINAADFNGDGAVDVVAGPYWYEGPEWNERHAIYEPVALPPERSPSNSMFSFVHDFDGDGDIDVLRLGRVHLHQAFWFENPGNDTDEYWKEHFVFARVRGESPVLVDLDNDGRPQLICHWDGRWGFIQPHLDDATRPWEFQAIGDQFDWPQFYHGTGYGDVNGDGALDVLINHGWFEQPAENSGGDGRWPFHSFEFSQARGGAQMFATDIDGDQRPDVISSLDAHGWGLAWFQQAENGASFRPRMLMGSRTDEQVYGVAFSQPHALQMADLDGDGRSDVVVGKRVWAHGPDGDIEPNATPVIYWFRQVDESENARRFVPYLIDDASGVGTQITVVDVNGDQRPDVLTASKLGAFVMLNLPAED